MYDIVGWRVGVLYETDNVRFIEHIWVLRVLSSLMSLKTVAEIKDGQWGQNLGLGPWNRTQ